MSSAIKVLKSLINVEKKEIAKSNYESPLMPDELNALGEAIVALEKQKELKEWLEKEITSNEDKIKLNIAFAESYSGVNNGIMCEKDFLDDIEKIKIENRILKEVLERVGEQK